MLESIFDNVRNRPFNKKRPQHNSFPVNLWKILNTPVATFIVILNTGEMTEFKTDDVIGQV